MKPIFDGFFDGLDLAFSIFCGICILAIIISLFSC